MKDKLDVLLVDLRWTVKTFAGELEPIIVNKMIGTCALVLGFAAGIRYGWGPGLALGVCFLLVCHVAPFAVDWFRDQI